VTNGKSSAGKNSASRSINKLVAVNAILAAILMISASAFAVTEGDLKREPKPDDIKVRKLEVKLTDSAVSEELEEADNSSYEAAAKELTIQEQNIKNDIVRLQKQIASLKVGKEQAKKNVELNRKKMEFQQNQNLAARKRAAKALAEKMVVDEQNAKLVQQLHQLESDERDSNEETRKIETFIRMAQDERKEIQLRQAKTRANIENQKQLQKTRRAQYENYRKNTKAIESSQATGVEPNVRQAASLGGN
jgi:chromosome segregation ATPase